MSSTVVDETSKYRLERDDNIDAVVFTWKDFAAGDEFRNGANQIIENFETNSLSKLIVDSRGIDAHDNEDQQWLQEEWTPGMVNAGMEYMANVYPESVIAEMDVEELKEAFAEFPLENNWTHDMQEARKWIQQQ